MTQGSQTVTQVTTEAVSAAQLEPTTIKSRWLDANQIVPPTAIDLATYALARQIHWAAGDENPKFIDSDAFVDAALRKLVRCFNPISNATKLANGQRAFRALTSVLSSLISDTRVDHFSRIGLDEGAVLETRQIAQRIMARTRELGIHRLRELAPKQPAPRPKTPYLPE